MIMWIIEKEVSNLLMQMYESDVNWSYGACIGHDITAFHNQAKA